MIGALITAMSGNSPEYHGSATLDIMRKLLAGV